MIETKRPTIQLTLDANAVAAPVHAAAVTCREVVDFYFDAIAKADLSKKPPGIEGNFFRFDVAGPDLDADSRRAMHESWILAKAFQDLMRGVRASLEQAHLFIEILGGPHSVKSDSTMDEFTRPFLERAARRKFPALLGYVNSKLRRPLEFAAAYQSLQNARNCLEHRGGVVGKPDVGSDGEMELSFPRMKAFYERHGQEIEIEPGVRIDAGNDEPFVTVSMRLDVRLRRYGLGQRLTLTIADFNEIAFACYHFGSQLATNLPLPGEPSV